MRKLIALVGSAFVAMAVLGAPSAQAADDRPGAAAPKPKKPRGVPELSAGAAGAAIALVAGSALVLAGRRRRSKAS